MKNSLRNIAGPSDSAAPVSLCFRLFDEDLAAISRLASGSTDEDDHDRISSLLYTGTRSKGTFKDTVVRLPDSIFTYIRSRRSNGGHRIQADRLHEIALLLWQQLKPDSNVVKGPWPDKKAVHRCATP